MRGKRYFEVQTTILLCRVRRISIRPDEFENGCAKSEIWQAADGTGGNGAWLKTRVVRASFSLTVFVCEFADAHAGFAIFFTIFEMTRRLAAEVKSITYERVMRRDGHGTAQNHIPRIANAVTLVTGGAVAGLAYELVCRPWDVARKAMHVDHVLAIQDHSVASVLIQKARQEGWSSFFRAPGGHAHETYATPAHRRVHTLLRTLGRVGPWGVGFLAWEAFGPGLS